MKRHPTDVFSFVSGLLFAGLGVLFALHATGTVGLDVRVVPAVVLITLGIGGIAAAVSGRPRPPADAVETDEASADDRDAEVPG